MLVLQIRHSSRHPEGLRPARRGSSPLAQENSSGHQGPAGRPIDRPRHRGSLGPIARIELSEGHRRPLPLSVTQGNGTPGKLDCAITIRCLPRQRYAGASDPYRSEDPVQIRNRLRICSRPAHALPVLLIPPPGGPTACPEGKADPRPRRAKVAPRSQQDSSGTGHSSGRTRDPLEEHSSQRAADSPGHAPPNSRHPEGLRPARKVKQTPGPGERKSPPGANRTA